MEIFVNSMVLAGAGLLLMALFPVWHLFRDLSRGICRIAWFFLSGLIAFFFLGYIFYAYLFWGRAHHWSDAVVPFIFFFGAIFVFTVCSLSAVTADGVCRLERENVTDPLMGIYNRRYMERCLPLETANARSNGLQLSIMLIDIDHFKRVNDTHGHSVGDQVLRVLARQIKHCVRDFDLVFRYGGEEILILLPNTGGDEALIAAERLRGKVAERQLKITTEDGLLDVALTISLGVSCLAPEAEDWTQLVTRADAALYRAKKAGRNCTVFSTGPDKSAELRLVGAG